ncbi:MAG: mycofactocin radical SAM maturase [Pseudomonadota bacterium]
MLSDLARKGLSAPVTVTWEITLRCNLSCRHCLSAAGEPMDGELSTEECFKVIDELDRLKIFQMNLGGGEPFIRPDIFDILLYAQNKGIVSCVSTNGTLLTEGTCRRLAQIDGLYLQVSLDGIDEDVNDGVRGKGTYSRILPGLDRLADQNVDFSINMVLTKPSFPQIDDAKVFAARYGARLRVSRFRPAGRGRDTWAELAPTKDQLESFARWLSADPEVMTGDSFFSLTSERRRRLGLDMCGAGKMTVCLSPDGNVYPCAFLQEQPFLVGNVRETSLEDMWRGSQVLAEFRGLEARSCESCFRFDSCRGGCPAVAYFRYGEVGLPDPECLVQCLRRSPSNDPSGS